MSHVTPRTPRTLAGRSRRRPRAVAVAVLTVLTVLGLLGLGPVGAASAAEPTAAQWAAMGSTSAPAYRLAAGCARYHYDYRIAPPEPEWALEVVIADATGLAQASAILLSGADATSGRRTFQLCSNNVATGRFTIRARLTYRHYASAPLFDETRDYAGWIAPSSFQVERPRTVKRAGPRCVKARKKARRLKTATARRAAHRACRRS